MFGGSYVSVSDSRLHFGLGPADRVERLDVRWADGARSRYEGLAGGRVVRLPLL